MTCLGFIVSFAVVFLVANAPPGCCVTVQIVSFHAINITPFFECLEWLARPFSPLAKMHFFSLILCDDENSDFFTSITSQLMGQISLFFVSIFFDYFRQVLIPREFFATTTPCVCPSTNLPKKTLLSWKSCSNGKWIRRF